MLVYQRSRSFRKFLEQRDDLLIQFKQGDLNKREFIEANLATIDRMGLKPFTKIDSFEKGVYTYQYYNMMAKYTYLNAKDVYKKGKHMKQYEQMIKEVDAFYRLKDDTTYKLLRFLEFENTEAYYIKVKSPFLKDKLFEIVITKPEQVILHSKNPWLRSKLEEYHVFLPGTKFSLADAYVNQKY